MVTGLRVFALKWAVPVFCQACADSRLPRDDDLADRSRVPRPSSLAPHEIDSRRQRLRLDYAPAPRYNPLFLGQNAGPFFD